MSIVGEKKNFEIEITDKDKENYKEFLGYDDEIKLFRFSSLSDEKIYKLFICQENYREQNVYGYINKAKHYDYISKDNASTFLKIEGDHIAINWPGNYGYDVKTIRPLEDYKNFPIFVSRVEIGNEDDKEWDKIVEAKITHKSIRVENSIGNCICIGKDSILKDDEAYVIPNKEKSESTDETEKHIINIFNKFNGAWPSNSKRSIPKKTKYSSICCGEFDIETYKKIIDLIFTKFDNISADNYKSILSVNKISTCEYFRYLQECYNRWLKIKNEYPFRLNRLFNAKYGYFGNVASFGDLKGGALQMNTIFDFETLYELGLIKKFVFKGVDVDGKCRLCPFSDFK